MALEPVEHLQKDKTLHFDEETLFLCILQGILEVKDGEMCKKYNAFLSKLCIKCTYMVTWLNVSLDFK